MTPRVHLLLPDATAEQRRMGRTLCGTSATRLTEERLAVTCRFCVRALPHDETPMGIAEAWEALCNLLAGPVVESVPRITPDEWRLMQCRLHDRPRDACPCAWCSWERKYRGRCDAWDLSQQLRPHRRYAHPFGSVAAALEHLLRVRTTGPSTRSWQGPLTDRAEQVMRLGTEVQTTQRFDRDPLELRRVDLAIDVERVLLRCFAEASERRGLSVEACAAVVLYSVAEPAAAARSAFETGLSERAVKRLVAHAKRELGERLAAEGLTPPPRQRRAA